MAEEKDKPYYYAIIPASVRYDKALNANAKLLYGEITALCNKEGYCWATNNYFSNLYEVSERSIINWINLLREKGYIKTKFIYKKNSNEIDKRLIFISDPMMLKTINGGDENNFTPPPETGFTPPGENNFTTPPENNFKKGGEKNFTYNNTSSFDDNSLSLIGKKQTKGKFKISEEEIKKIFLDNNYFSDPETYFLTQEKKKWKEIKDKETLIADIKLWEKRFKEYYPDKVEQIEKARVKEQQANIESKSEAQPQPKIELTEEQKTFWQDRLNDIREEFNQRAYDQYLSKITLHSVKDNEIILAADSKFLRDWVKREYLNGGGKSGKGIKQICQEKNPNLKNFWVISTTSN